MVVWGSRILFTKTLFPALRKADYEQCQELVVSRLSGPARVAVGAGAKQLRGLGLWRLKSISEEACARNLRTLSFETLNSFLASLRPHKAQGH